MDLVVGPWGARPAAPEPLAAPEREGTFACEQCGAVLRFTPGTTTLTCSYCGHVNTIEAAPPGLAEADLDAALARFGEAAPPTDAVQATCDGCGANFAFPAPLHAGLCPYCGQAVVVAPQGPLSPAGVLPFLIGEAHARERIDAWLARLWFAPNGLKARVRGRDALHGLYMPAFTFDSATATRFRGLRGDVYYETRRVPVVVNGKRTTQVQQVPKVRWRPVAGETARRFDDVLVAASRTLPADLVARLRDFDTHEARPYQPDFLVGFDSEQYQLSLAAAATRARERMREVVAGDVRARIGGDMQKITAMDVRFDEDAYKLVLVPLWRAQLRFLARVYPVLVNGRTGEVVGARPWSFWKIAGAIALALGAAALVAASTMMAPFEP